MEQTALRDYVSIIFRNKDLWLRDFPPTRSLLDWLREDRRATGTKEGCNEGDCGACTVVLARLEDGELVYRPVNACITLLGMADGAEILTIEDLADGTTLHPIQQAMVDHHGSQCGFCTPGIVMSLFAMGKEGGAVDRDRINDQLAGNLCRCTGYRPIVDAALASAGAPDRFDAMAAQRIARLEAIDGLDDDVGALIGAEDAFFAAPRTLADALALYAEHPDATILAGATDVGLWITKQFRPVTKLIWLGRIAELQGIEDGEVALRIGAGVTHEAALPHLAALSPDLGELGRRFGSKQVRAQGTVGGNIANGSPIGDWAPAFIALDAEVALGARKLPLESFFIAYGKQDRQPGEIVTALSIPKLRDGQHFRCLKISKRFDEDISALMGAFRLTVTDGRVTEARVAFGGMAATPKRAPQTEVALVGASLTDRSSWSRAIDALAADYSPIDDMRASSRYRAETARALLVKVLVEIGGGEGTRIRQPRQGEASHAA